MSTLKFGLDFTTFFLWKPTYRLYLPTQTFPTPKKTLLSSPFTTSKVLKTKPTKIMGKIQLGKEHQQMIC
jgi:hypothetical protein